MHEMEGSQMIDSPGRSLSPPDSRGCSGLAPGPDCTVAPSLRNIPGRDYRLHYLRVVVVAVADVDDDVLESVVVAAVSPC